MPHGLLHPISFLLGAILLCGCNSLEKVYELPEEPPTHPSEDFARITDRHGGTHHRTIVLGQLWYQAYANSLLVLDVHDGRIINTFEPFPFGEAGSIVDMVILGKRMYLVLDGDAVVELDLADQRSPALRQVKPSHELGIRPRNVSVVDGVIWISGDGGVVRWHGDAQPKRLGGHDSTVAGKVVATRFGPAAPVGRRVHAVEDGAFLGAASYLAPLPDEAGLPDALLFVLQSTSGASVGVMGPAVRELDDFAINGTVRGIRYADGRIWAFSDTEIGTAELLPDGTLGPVKWIPVKGVRDLDGAGPNYLAVGGTFGRALYRFNEDDAGKADSFFAVVRKPGQLDAALNDGRRVLTGSEQGTWLYTIGDSIKLVTDPITRNVPPSDFAAANWGDARIVDDGNALVLHLDGVDHEWRAPNDSTITTIVAMGRRLWVGHEGGLNLIRINGPEDAYERNYFNLPPAEPWSDAGFVRITSGVSHVLPVRVGDEVVWVSPNGGIGVAKIERTKLEGWAPNSSG